MKIEELRKIRMDLVAAFEEVGNGSGQALLDVMKMTHDLLNSVESDMIKKIEGGKKKGKNEGLKVCVLAAIAYKEAMEVPPAFRSDPWETAVVKTLNYMKETAGRRTVLKNLKKNRGFIEQNYLEIIKVIESKL